MAGEEARAFLHSLLQDYDSAKHAKILFDYCLKNYEKKDEIMDMLLAEISLVPRDQTHPMLTIFFSRFLRAGRRAYFIF